MLHLLLLHPPLRRMLHGASAVLHAAWCLVAADSCCRCAATMALHLRSHDPNCLPAPPRQVYGCPIGGTIVREPWATDGSGSTFLWGFLDSEYK